MRLLGSFDISHSRCVSQWQTKHSSWTRRWSGVIKDLRGMYGLSVREQHIVLEQFHVIHVKRLCYPEHHVGGKDVWINRQTAIRMFIGVPKRNTPSPARVRTDSRNKQHLNANQPSNRQTFRNCQVRASTNEYHVPRGVKNVETTMKDLTSKTTQVTPIQIAMIQDVPSGTSILRLATLFAYITLTAQAHRSGRQAVASSVLNQIPEAGGLRPSNYLGT